MDTLFPHSCAFCGQICREIPLFPGVCRICLARLPLRDRKSSLIYWNDLGLADGIDLSGIICASWYQEPVRGALLRLKFADSPELAKALTALILQSWRQTGLDCSAVAAVPLHKARLQERGYNQAALLAANLSQWLDRPDWSDYLIRTRSTVRQSGLDNQADRRINMQDAFSLSSALPESAKKSASRKPVLIVDDILTTGTTLFEAVKPLRQAGCQVIGLVASSAHRSRQSETCSRQPLSNSCYGNADMFAHTGCLT